MHFDITEWSCFNQAFIYLLEYFVSVFTDSYYIQEIIIFAIITVSNCDYSCPQLGQWDSLWAGLWVILKYCSVLWKGVSDFSPGFNCFSKEPWFFPGHAEDQSRITAVEGFVTVHCGCSHLLQAEVLIHTPLHLYLFMWTKTCEFTPVPPILIHSCKECFLSLAVSLRVGNLAFVVYNALIYSIPLLSGLILFYFSGPPFAWTT